MSVGVGVPFLFLGIAIDTEPLSKLLVSPLITPMVIPQKIPAITPFKEFRI